MTVWLRPLPKGHALHTWVMSYSVSVVQPHEACPINLDIASNEEIDAWLASEQVYVRFEAPIAPDSLFAQFFSTTAWDLDLPLLASVYDHGLELVSSVDLNQLLYEVETIQTEWDCLDLQRQWQDELHGPGRWERLQEGAEDLKRAARLALEQQLLLSLG